MRGESFCVCVWREWEPLIPLTAWIWRGLWPRLVYAAGCFPEQAAQGRGTCSSLKHWSRLTGGVRGSGMERCLMVPGNWHVLNLWNPQVEQSGDLQKKIFALVFYPVDKRRRGHSQPSYGEVKSHCRRTKVIIGASRPVLATTKKSNTKFMDRPVFQMRQYFPSIGLGWPNTTYLKFIKPSVIPADLREYLIIWYIAF